MIHAMTKSFLRRNTLLGDILHDDPWQTIFRRSRELDEVLRELRILLGDPNRRQFRVPAAAQLSMYTNWHHPETLNTMGFASYQMGGSWEVVIGNYCSVAGGLQVMGERHPVVYTTSSSIHYDKFKPHFAAIITDFGIDWHKTEPAVKAYGPLPEVEHDVWIGAHVTLARGIRIGTGAVIATGSIVTKDVAPYSIVAGNPARHKRMRFDDATAEKLLESRWWEYANVIGAVDMREPNRFWDTFAEANEMGRLTRISHTHYDGCTIASAFIA
jgi:acetyltransferase-like isoleucine patch superfamily enzyme